MHTLPFEKMQGVGNDFVLVDARAVAEGDWPSLAPQICHRHFGVGADGLLVVAASEHADVAMRMFNPDGTEDFCGNGLRCVARYVSDHAPGESGRLAIATIAGIRQATVRRDASGRCAITVEMGVPAWEPAAIPAVADVDKLVDFPLDVAGERIPVTSLSTGTAHTVIFVDALPDDERFHRLSPAIENHPLFPERTSVMWTRVESPERLAVRIWERGAGETWGCGSGACAAFVAARHHGFVGDSTTVASKGGDLVIEWPGSGPILMTGPAEYVFTGDYERR